MNDQVRATTRIPKKLADWLKKRAKAESRSVNGQLVYELELARRRVEEPV
ncbi:MAG: Arc family DNA-binding protein [Gammaproteobacteria bacterium]|nr:Arc family DNA-binding protein [Gammaproteobacteria bacterium]MBU0789892.1 Arc family DNA-binding protein [Gammaproteobacteria bacterium]MBU1805300.1 Arc family DNA-binding protein [Gammaproteobacteria bacterium]